MNEQIKKIKKIIMANQDKRILILNCLTSVNLKIQRLVGLGEHYEEVLDKLLIDKFGYIDIRYIPREEQEKIATEVVINKGIPLFSKKIVASDIIIFLNINSKTLRILCDRDNVSYEMMRELQNSFQKKLKQLDCKIITVNLYPYNKALANVGRKIYILDNQEYDLLNKKDIADLSDKIDKPFLRFPYINQITNFEDLKRKQGFLLIIKEDYLNVHNYIDIDKKYRKLFKQFNLVYIITEDVKKLNRQHINFSNIYFAEKNYFDNDILNEIYYDYILENKEIRYSKKKMLIINKMTEYFKNKYTMKTKEIAQYLNMSKRNIERYMHDYNNIYKNIGYDYVNNEWYIIH